MDYGGLLQGCVVIGEVEGFVGGVGFGVLDYFVDC